MVTLLLAAANLSAAPIVNWLSGGPNTGHPSGAGYVDGDITTDAEYHTPCGLVMDNSGNYLFVADRDNNAVRLLQFDVNWTYHLVGADQNGKVITNLFNKPVGVALDTANNFLFVVNRGNGVNGSVLEIDLTYGTVITNLTKITNAGGITVDPLNNIYVTASNKVFKVASSGVSNVVATVTAAHASLQGIVFKHNGLLAVCDTGRNGILLVNPTNGVISTNAGFHGAGDFSSANNVAPSNTAKFFQPTGVAEAGDGSLIVTDFGNHRVKRVMVSGIVTNLYGVISNDWVTPYKGFMDGTVQIPDKVGGVAARLPNGVALAPDGTVYVTEDYYHIIRMVTGSGLPLPPPPPLPPPDAPTGLTATTNYGMVILTWFPSTDATNYNIKRSPSSGGPYTIIGSSITTSYTDTNVINGTTYYYVVSALGAGGESTNSLEVSATPPIPPPVAPRIGWFDYEGNDLTGYFSVLHPVSASGIIFHNDTRIAIDPTVNGLSTYYTSDSSTPSATNGSTPPFYEDNYGGYLQPLSVTIAPDLFIKAVNVDAIGQSSPVTTAQFIFQVANPTINGNNGALFTVSDETTNATLWYTLDGTNPTNAPPSIGPIAFTFTNSVSSNNNLVTISINVNSNVLFQARAFRNDYQPSGIAARLFSPSNFVPNSISFGFVSGEASSDFVASSGQTFYAPVTLAPLPSTVIYSLQFNLTVTNGGPNPGPAISPGAYSFTSMLKKPDLDHPGFIVTIPPYMFIGSDTAPVPPGQVIIYDNTNFVSLVTTNLSLNLLGVGWMERMTQTNLYDTTAQDLIAMSMAHDTEFLQNGGKVIVGGYAFQVPLTAAPGQTYQIQIGRPSATSDGQGAPGSSVFIYAPTNGSLTNGPINSIKNVTVGQRKYIVGDVYPFRWFNAGDFGSGDLIVNGSPDVEQVFEAAIYNLNSPTWQAPGSDFLDAMDSCGGFGVFNAGTGYYTYTGPLTVAQQNALFDGNDTTINQIAFGDGNLDVCDVYVTFRRSLDPSLTWYRRFWTNGVLVAETVPNQVATNSFATSLSVSKSLKMANLDNSPVSITNQPKVIFIAGDCQTNAGSTIQIPITASIFGKYPLRVLMLNLSIVPLDGSPALTTPVQFTANSVSALGQPYKTDSIGNGNYAATWLPANVPISSLTGLTGNTTLGTLTVTLPTNATSLSAYAIHFDHASASPNGMASFPKQARTGLITFSSRTNSSYGDGIPDSWRLRYFLTLNNYLSQTNADADGDGVDNLHEYLAGTDPTDPTSCFKKIGTDAGAALQPQDCVISWPSAIGKQYVIQRSPSLSTPLWTSIATNSGNGTIMEFHDTSGSGIRYYRVRVQ